MRSIGIPQRRARLGLRHRLVRPARTATVAEAADAMVALHATDPATVFLSIRARTAPVDVAAIEHALYQERSVLRMLGMRRTMFVLPVERAAMMQAACANAIASQQRQKYAQFLTAAGVGDAVFLKEIEDATAVALDVRGEATGAQLSVDEPRLRTQIELSVGKAYGGKQNITSWVLFLLAADGRIARGRPMGSWTSTQWRWSPMREWLPGGIEEVPLETARAELVRRWLGTFGPGTVADLRWWTGWTAGHVKQALAAVGAVEVDLDGATGVVLPDDLEPVPESAPWVALLPALDPTPMGWSQRSWYLGPHATALFDRNGNIGPSVWCDGRIVGGWAQRTDGDVVWRPLEDIGAEAAAQVATAAGNLTQWLGPVRVTPRFRTPLERELVAAKQG